MSTRKAIFQWAQPDCIPLPSRHVVKMMSGGQASCARAVFTYAQHTVTAGAPLEVLHLSENTRVFVDPAWPGLVFKEAYGEGAQRQLARESRILGCLRGAPGVVQLAPPADIPWRGSHVLALEDCGRLSLAQKLRTQPMPVDKVLELSIALTRALGEVHQRGFVHLDICPANVLLPPAGGAVLADFGLAVAQADALAVPHGEVVGTLGYLAPEQTGRIDRRVDHRADLHALGATIYEMATGRIPFAADDSLQLVHEHLVRVPTPPVEFRAELPLALSDAAMRLLEKEPDQRYQATEGLLHDLLRIEREWHAGNKATFDVGERDFAARLSAPSVLVGRDRERKAMREAFDKSRGDRTETVLVEGPPGVGKSALINDLQPEIAAAGGWFLYGKFDQFQKDVTIEGGVTQVLRALLRMVLAEPESELDAHRSRIATALGRNAGAMAQQLPELGVLLQSPPVYQPVDPRQAEFELRRSIMGMFETVASAGRPLVVVLEDLQWAGKLSFQVFEWLMDGSNIRGLLLIGSYRRNEATASTAMDPVIAQWLSLREPPLLIELDALSQEAAGEFVGQMLRLPHEGAEGLAAAVSTLARGNPFDTVELLNALREDNVLRLDPDGWRWDSTAVRHFVGRRDVVDLLAARVTALPRNSRRLVECMSCLGGRVQRRLLVAALSTAASDVEQSLRAPLEGGLILVEPGGHQISFRHDRVQQAVLACHEPDRREGLQLELARNLAAHPEFDTDAAQQYLGCTKLLVDPHEALEVARMFLKFAARLCASAGFAVADRFLHAATSLLDEHGASTDPELKWAVNAARHSVFYGLGKLNEADAIYEVISLRDAFDPIELAPCTCLQIRSLLMRAKSPDALSLGFELLSKLGIPGNTAVPDERQIGRLTDWVRQQVGGNPRTSTAMADPQALAIASLLDAMMRAAVYLVDLDTMAWILVEAHRLWVQHGPCAMLVPCLCRASIFFIAGRGDYRTGFEAARHALAVGEALGFEPQTSEARQVFAGIASHWGEPIETTYQHALQARTGLLAHGDPAACYGYPSLSFPLFDFAPNIERTASEVQEGLDLCARAGNDYVAASLLSQRQMLRSLAGQTDSLGSFDDSQFELRSYAGGLKHFPISAALHHLHRALAACVFRNLSALWEATETLEPLLHFLPGYYATFHARLLRSLAIAARLRDTGADREGLAQELEGHRRWLQLRADDAPFNYSHALLWLEAERYWSLGDPWAAARAFDAALSLVFTVERPWHRALIAECSGHFHLQSGMLYEGRRLIALAREGYRAWGAAGKVSAMEKEHAWLTVAIEPEEVRPSLQLPAGARLNGSNANSVDSLAILRASQALSSETSLSRLGDRMTEIVGALTGATEVRLALWDEELGKWTVPTAKEPTEEGIPAEGPRDRELLSFAGLRYAERTREPLIIHDAVTDHRFAQDPYVAGLTHCSMLVLPIQHQGSLRAMLLLENRLIRGAFSAGHLDAVSLIAGQLAVSLQNALLYDRLERKVREQTHALLTAARRAGMAQIANNVLHNVGNVLNSVNTSAHVLREQLTHSRAARVSDLANLLACNTSDLATFFSTDKGRILPDYLKELGLALAGELEQQLSELSRLESSVEHIKNVVAMQQSYAGARAVLEHVSVADLVEDALRLQSNELARNDISIIREYEFTDTLAIDRTRLMQILLNLVENAFQAMESTSGERILRVSVRHEARCPVIRISDNGAGIDSSNVGRIFAHGFTTKPGGHGFGLHSCAVAAIEMGGEITAHSDGPGKGATFTVRLSAQAGADSRASIN